MEKYLNIAMLIIGIILIIFNVISILFFERIDELIFLLILLSYLVYSLYVILERRKLFDEKTKIRMKYWKIF